MDNLNKSVFIKEIESIINNLPKKKAEVLNGFTGEFYQIYMEEIL